MLSFGIVRSSSELRLTNLGHLPFSSLCFDDPHVSLFLLCRCSPSLPEVYLLTRATLRCRLTLGTCVTLLGPMGSRWGLGSPQGGFTGLSPPLDYRGVGRCLVGILGRRCFSRLHLPCAFAHKEPHTPDSKVLVQQIPFGFFW